VLILLKQNKPKRTDFFVLSRSVKRNENYLTKILLLEKRKTTLTSKSAEIRKKKWSWKEFVFVGVLFLFYDKQQQQRR
jgi:hypothetical protein